MCRYTLEDNCLLDREPFRSPANQQFAITIPETGVAQVRRDDYFGSRRL
jgi:hypothetical protein